MGHAGGDDVSGLDIRRLASYPAGSGWLATARRFGQALRGERHDPGSLFVVGAAGAEPWHLTAHLQDAARWAQLPGLSATLIRHSVPTDAPSHLRAGVDVLDAAGPRTTVLVEATCALDDRLRERLAGASRRGAGLYVLHAGDEELATMARADLVQPPIGVLGASTETLSHLVPRFAAEGHAPGTSRRSRWLRA